MRKSLVATAALGLALATTPAYAASARKPNVIVILADDLGYGDTGVYGSKIVKTPNIDALAADGVRFTQGYVSHPVCAPSRAALLTGRYQTRFGYEFNPVGRDRTSGVSLDETFIGQVMQKAGYRTGMVGKWHLGESGGYHPVARGFDEFFGTTAGANAFIIDTKPGDEFHTPRGAEGSYGTVEGGSGLAPGPIAEQMVQLRERAPITRGRGQVVEVNAYLTDAFTDDAVRFIGANKDRPFFLYLSHTTPHTPLQAPAKYIDRYKHIENKGQRVYAAMVSSLDDSVGALRAKLKAEGIEKDTLIVLLSDNGCAGYVGDACTNAPLNGYKGMHLEGGVRVPFIMAWPGHIEPKVETRVVSSLDIAPTAAALAGGVMPKGSDGVNLIPYLTGKDAGAPHPTLYWRSGVNFAIRDGDWKMWMINRAEPSDVASNAARVTPEGVKAELSPRGHFVMLYDLKTDPGETKNLAATRSDVVAQLKTKIEAWDEGNVPPQWTSMRQSVREVEGELVRLYP